MPRKGRPAIWHAGETVNMSIGQGAVLVTPMQVARFMSAIANGGVLWKPRLVQRIERPEKGVVWSDAGSVNGHVELAPMVGRCCARRCGPSSTTAAPVGGPHSRPRHRRQDRHRADHRQLPVGQGAGSRLVHRLRAGEGSRGRGRRPGGAGWTRGSEAAPIARQILNAIFFEKVASVDIDG
jgi:hypothetical protein